MATSGVSRHVLGKKTTPYYFKLELEKAKQTYKAHTWNERRNNEEESFLEEEIL